MEHLESHHIKDKDGESIETEQAQEQYRVQYGSLLERHHQLDERLRKLERSATVRFQEKTKGLIDDLDQERHNVHLIC